ncbi:MAG TPA: tripartite tricarboxylate transporter substrate binding protein [Burkholderiales bacterium]|nr:tripartite tricarboxylate transporter substrate binding protein [Burkholderiales bacterium]
MAASPAWSQGYPAKPVRIVVGFSAGSTTDLIGRVLATKLGEGIGQLVVVDNRPGAGANIAAEIVSKSPPDGYTVLLANAGLATGATAYVKLNFNALRDFAPVAQVSATPHILVVHPSLPAKHVKELIAFMKPRPGQLNFSSTGHGNSDHLAAELFMYMTGLKMVHITYKGGPQAIGDVATGEVAMYFAGLPVSIPFVKNGRVRALGVTGAKRARVLPDVPTIAEAGVAGYEHILWGMLVVPSATPREVIARLNDGVVKALNAPDIRERYAGMGVEPAPSTPEQAAGYLRSETEKYAKVVKAIGLRLE